MKRIAIALLLLVTIVLTALALWLPPEGHLALNTVMGLTAAWLYGRLGSSRAQRTHASLEHCG